MRLQCAAARACLAHVAALLIGSKAFHPIPEAHALEQLPAPLVAWQAPEGCPSSEAVLQRLSSLTSASPEQLAAAGEVHGRIERAARGGWQLSLEIRARDGAESVQRTLSASECDELADAGAVAIALALGDVPGSAELPGPRAASPLGAANESAERAARDRRADSPASSSDSSSSGSPRSVTFAASAALTADSASVGGLALGPRARLQVGYSSLAAGLYALWLPARETGVGTSQFVDVSLRAAGIDVCHRATEQVLSLYLCAGFEVGLLRGSGRGLSQARERRDLWLAPNWGARAVLALPLELQIELQLDAILPLGRQRYAVDDIEVVYVVPDTSLRAGVGLGGVL